MIERIAREIGTAQSVRSSSGLLSTVVNGNATSIPRDSVIAQVQGQNGDIVDIVLPHAKIDVIRPAEGDPTLSGAGFVNPATGMVDPTLSAPKGDVNLPLVPGPVWVRYAIGLRDPFSEYNNPYDGRIMARNAQRDNLYVLYRIQFQPYVSRGGAYRPNLALFDADASDRTIINDGLDDPRFLVPNRDGTGQIIINDAKAKRIKHWLGQNPDGVSTNYLGKAVMQTDLSRYDMIQAVADDSQPPRAAYDGIIPRVFPLVSFQPTRVSNEIADGQTAVRQGEESDNAQAIGPDVFRTKHPLWENAVIRMWPTGWKGDDNARNAYLIGRGSDGSAAANQPKGFSIFAYAPSSGTEDYVGGSELFDVFTYNLVLAQHGRFPFTQAAMAANGRSNWLSDSALRALFTPFVYQSGSGKIISSFGINEVGDPASAVDVSNPDNLPTVATGAALSVVNETATGGTFSDGAHFGYINTMFNKLWIDYPSLQGSTLERFIDLRVTSSGDGTPSPLSPIFSASAPTDLAKVKIVPGSEQVYGPDQLPGPGYGRIVRYTRTTKRPVGPNQYLINYVDQPEPDYSILGLPSTELSTFNPAVYKQTNLISAVIQPRFKKGYIALSADPNIPIPAGNFQVSYRFQFTGSQTGPSTLQTGNKADTFAVDYDTRQLMAVLLTIRNYPQSSAPNPQNVTLKATATVRNYAR